MKEKTKKWLITAGLTVVGVALAVGIGMRLYKEETVPVASDAEESEVDIVTETEPVTMLPSPTPMADEEAEEELVIETEEKTDVNEDEQQIQPSPEKTETQKPEETPELQAGTDLEDAETVPAYNEEPEATVETETGNQQNQTPVHGDKKDGMIYVDGFGWVPNEGGGGVGIVAEDMYENGNKIGIME